MAWGPPVVAAWPVPGAWIPHQRGRERSLLEQAACRAWNNGALPPAAWQAASWRRRPGTITMSGVRARQAQAGVRLVRQTSVEYQAVA